MATRLGLIAVRGDRVETLLEPFPDLAQASPAAEQGWAYASFGLFALGRLVGPSADETVGRLDRPGLQIWTEDDALWYLALHRPGRPPLRYVQWLHYFDVVRGREKPRKGVTLKKYIAEYEEDLPQGWGPLGKTPAGPVMPGLAKLLRARAELVADALAEAEVPHDRGTVVRALAGDDVTDEELEWGVGNLPRFLDAIGLGAVFKDWRQEIADAAEDKARARSASTAAAEQVDYAGKALAALSGQEPALLDRPVLAKPATLWLLPWAWDPDVEVAFVVRPSRPLKLKWPKAKGLSVVETGDAIHAGLAWQSVWIRTKIVAKLEGVFAKLPAGSALELVATAVRDDEDEPLTSGNMRFRGTVAKGRWTITHAWPPATAAHLEGVHAIFAWAARKGPFAAADEAEAAAIIALGEKSGEFGKDRPKAKGRSITVRPLWRPYLAMMAFRHRFSAGPWDVRGAQESAEKDEALWADAMSKLTAQFSEALAPFRGQELVHQGKRSAFRKADILAVKPRLRLQIGALFATLFPGRGLDRQPELAKGVAEVDAAMAAAGFRPLGDMVCEAFGEVVIRGYGRDAGDAYGVLYAGSIGQFVYELYTAFENGATLTTSINTGSAKRPSRHVHLPNATVETILAKHAEGVKKSKARPKAHPPELTGLAREIDAFLVRQGS